MRSKIRASLTLLLCMIVFSGALAGCKDNTPQIPQNNHAPRHENSISDDLSYHEVSSGRKRINNRAAQLFINGVECFYDATNRLFLYSISESAVLQERTYAISALSEDEEPYKIAVYDKVIMADGKYVSPGNETLRLRFYNETHYEDFELRISCVPLLMITTDNNKAITNRETEVPCTLQLMDPDADLSVVNTVFESRATIRLRGASAYGNEKKAYKVELKKPVTDETGKEVLVERKASLLGMREDDDWILDALYLDPTLIHNKMSYDLWQEIGADTNPAALSAGPHCKFIEIYLNGKYNGAYLLVEPVDEKQMGVDKMEDTEDGTHGVYLKTASWEGAKFEQIKGKPGKSATWMGFEIKYPAAKDIQEEDWQPLYKLLNDTVNGSDTDFTATASEYLDKENIVNYWILISTTLARDNAGKNICWSIANLDTSPKMYINAWDMDNAFGYRYGSPLAIKDPPTTPNYADEWFVLLRRYLENNVDGSADYLAERWAELTQPGAPCSVEALTARLEKEITYMYRSGAFEREKERWPNSAPRTLAEEYDYAADWIQDRIPIVTEIVNSYKNPEK